MKQANYEAVPSTGQHRGGSLEIPVTTSVRAQEATDPSRARREKEKKEPTQSRAQAELRKKPGR